MNAWDRQRADRLRAVPLEQILRRCGGEPDRSDPRKWRTPAGILSVCGPKFMNWSRGVGGGGAIDLAIHLKSLGFREAVEWLARNFADCGSSAARAQSPSPLRLPLPDSENLERVIAYLALQRAIPMTAVEALIRSGALYADSRANAVFLLLGKDNRPVGAELRGTTGRPWRGMAPGSRKDLGFFAVGPELANTIVLCESAIDALSCFTLHPACLVSVHLRCQARSALAFLPPGARGRTLLRLRRRFRRRSHGRRNDHPAPRRQTASSRAQGLERLAHGGPVGRLPHLQPLLGTPLPLLGKTRKTRSSSSHWWFNLSEPRRVNLGERCRDIP